jgi:hypothetical protein
MMLRPDAVVTEPPDVGALGLSPMTPCETASKSPVSINSVIFLEVPRIRRGPV